MRHGTCTSCDSVVDCFDVIIVAEYRCPFDGDREYVCPLCFPSEEGYAIPTNYQLLCTRCWSGWVSAEERVDATEEIQFDLSPDPPAGWYFRNIPFYLPGPHLNTHTFKFWSVEGSWRHLYLSQAKAIIELRLRDAGGDQPAEAAEAFNLPPNAILCRCNSCRGM